MKSIYRYITLVAIMLVGTQLFGQTAKGRTGTFALTNATVETVTNGILENATVVISEGMIQDVGTNVTIPDGAESIDCSGQTIYPGFIDASTRLGLQEIGAVARTRDFNEIGEVIPHMQALTAVNPNSVLIPVTRVNGVTTVLSEPAGGLICGTAALINLHGYNPDQMYAGFKGVIINFPQTGRRSRWDRRTDEEIEKAAKKALKQLNESFDKATQYHKIDSAASNNDLSYYPEMEALLPVVRGEMKAVIFVNAAKDIKAAIKWIQERKLDAILTGVSEGWRVADEIKESGIPVIVAPVLGMPTRQYDRYDRPYANAGVLSKAGIKVAIATSETENVRNLPYHAGFAATYGMGREEALKAITINPAEIFGVADQMGSIEKGKAANLFVASGDPFEMKTEVKHLFISGWKIPLESRHTKLYDEFLERTPGVEK